LSGGWQRADVGSNLTGKLGNNLGSVDYNDMSNIQNYSRITPAASTIAAVAILTANLSADPTVCHQL